ncbi:MAG: CooT family nickel-binding protein [bacterium]
MCESRVYLDSDGKRESIMNSVIVVRPEDDGSIFLANLLGEQKVVRAKVKEIKLLEHKIILEA